MFENIVSIIFYIVLVTACIGFIITYDRKVIWICNYSVFVHENNETFTEEHSSMIVAKTKRKAKKYLMETFTNIDCIYNITCDDIHEGDIINYGSVIHSLYRGEIEY